MAFPNLTLESLPPLPPYISISASRIAYNGTKLQEYYQQYFTLFYNTHPHLDHSTAHYPKRYPNPLAPAPYVMCEDHPAPMLMLAGLITVIVCIFILLFFTGVWIDVEGGKDRRDAFERGRKEGLRLGEEEGRKRAREEWRVGREEGLLKGRKRGREEGLIAGRALGAVGRCEEEFVMM